MLEQEAEKQHEYMEVIHQRLIEYMMLVVLILLQKHLLLFLLIKTRILYMLIIIGGYLIKEIIKYLQSI